VEFYVNLTEYFELGEYYYMRFYVLIKQKNIYIMLPHLKEKILLY